MLDSYVEENEPAQHEVTDRLYGGGSEHRLRQELLLGIGGVRAVRAFCAITGHPEPEVFHTNEGHAGFLGLERIREYVAAGLSFDEALELSRAGTVFTTHTPVPAGIDRFPRELIERYFTADAAAGGAAGRPGARARRRDLPGRRPAHVQHGRHGHAPRAAGQRRLRAARRRSAGRCSRACGRGSTPPRCRSARSPTACTRPPGSRARSPSSATPDEAACRPARTSGAAVGDPPPAARPAGHRDQAAAARVLAAARRVRCRADLDRRRARRERADDRVRPPGAVLQAADADAATTRSGWPGCCSTRSGRSRS